jgi:hypothetical protein
MSSSATSDATYTFPDSSFGYGTFLFSPEDDVFVGNLKETLQGMTKTARRFEKVTTWDGRVVSPADLAEDICGAAINDENDESFAGAFTVGTGTVVESKADPSTGYNIFRIKAKMSGPKEQILKLVTDASTLGSMDHTVRVLQPVWAANSQTRIVYNVTRVGSIFKDRDFFDFVCEREVDGALVSAAISIPSSLPEFPDIIRGWTMRWALILRDATTVGNESDQIMSTKETNKMTDMTIICQASINGWMPAWIINLTTGSFVAQNYVGELEKRLVNGSDSEK